MFNTRLNIAKIIRKFYFSFYFIAKLICYLLIGDVAPLAYVFLITFNVQVND